MSKPTFNYAQAARKGSSSVNASAAPSPPPGSPAPSQEKQADAPKEAPSSNAAEAVNGNGTAPAAAAQQSGNAPSSTPAPQQAPETPAKASVGPTPANTPATGNNANTGASKKMLNKYFQKKPPQSQQPQATSASSAPAAPAPALAESTAAAAASQPATQQQQQQPAAAPASQPMGKSASTFDATTSPRPPQQQQQQQQQQPVVPAPAQPGQFPQAATPAAGLATSARSFTPAGMPPAGFTPNGPPPPPAFVPGAGAHAQPFKPNGPPYQNQQGFQPRGGPQQQQQPQQQQRQRFNSATSPRMPNGQLPPGGVAAPQPGFYPQYSQPAPGQGGNWQPPAQGYYPYQQFYPGQFPPNMPPPAGLQQSQNAGAPPPPPLSASSSTQAQPPRSPSVLSSSATPRSPASSAVSLPSGTPVRPGSAASSPSIPGASIPRSGTPQASASPFRPGAASFNPSAGEFTPSPSFFQPRKEGKGPIQIRKPPVSSPSKGIPIRPPPGKEEADKAEAEKKASNEAADAKIKAEAAAKAKAEEEAAQAKEQAEAKAKADAEAAKAADDAKAAAQAKEKEEAEAAAKKEAETQRANEERARKEKEEADIKAKEEADKQQKAAAEAKAKADRDAAEQEQKAKDQQQAAEQKPAQPPAAAAPAAAAAAAPAPEAGSSKEAESSKAGAEQASSEKSAAATNESIRNAKPIEDFSSVQYPQSVEPPRPELNQDAKPGVYRYERDFLLQFLNACKARPEALPSLEAIGMADADGSIFTPAGGHVGGPPGGMARIPSQGGNRRSGLGSSRPSSMSGTSRSGFNQPMGAFNSAPAKTSEQRFAQSLQGAGGFGPGGHGGFGSGRPGASRQNSMGPMGMGNIAGAGGRVRSDRGRKRGDGGGRAASHGPPQPQETFASLGITKNAWQPSVQAKAAPGQQQDPNSPEVVQKKVKGLLNKLTVERFDSISTQILEWANKSEEENDGRILRQVIALIFEKATDEAAWSEMYARLCRKLQEMVSPNVRDDTMVSAANPQPPAGGSLFRKYLLNRCQEDYERGWSERQKTASAAAGKADEDKAKLQANEAAKADAEKEGAEGDKPKEQPKEAEIMSDEYYAAQKAKRRGLGLVRFIGELYKLHMLTARIMHECIKKLLSNVNNPEEDDMESLCRLLTTVGGQLENEPGGKSSAIMDVYMERLGSVRTNDKVSSRIQFMVLDVIDLRKSGWQNKQASAGPKTIQQIHDDARKAELDASRKVSSSSRLPPMSQQLPRGGSRGGRGREVGADGWQQQRTAGEAGDLSQFGRVRSSAGNPRLGPSGAFGRGRMQKKEEAAPEPARQNSFAALALSGEDGDNGPAESAESERKPLKILPRTKPVEDEDSQAQEPGMSEEAIQRSVDNSVKEFFTMQDINEGQESFKALPQDARWRLNQKLINKAVNGKQAEVDIACKLFTAALEGSVTSRTDFLKAFEEDIKELAAVAEDQPYAMRFYVQMLKTAGMSREDTEALSKKMESEDEEMAEEARENLMTTFDK